MRPIYFYAPGLKRYETSYLDSSKGWKSVSVTGTSCAFSCKHCNTRVLENMEDGSTREKFQRVIEKVISEGYGGVIVSGGSTARGDVPLWKYSDILSKVKDRVTVIAHTGVVNEETAERMAEAGVKIALLDMVGDDKTIKEVLGQPFTVEDYLNSFMNLKRAGIKIVPHVILGLSRLGHRGDMKALESLSKVNPDAVIIVGLMPLVGTQGYLFKPPTPDEMVNALSRARELYSIPIMLGCARPRGKEYLKVETFVVDGGIDGIAYPEEETVEYAEGRRKIVLSHACCGNVVEDFLSQVGI